VSEWERPGASDDWMTPKYIFDALGVEFDADMAAPVVKPRHVPCPRWYFTRALSFDWSTEGFIWLNPPFGGRNGILPWLKKFVEHGDGIALTPDRTSAPWFQWAAPKMERILFVSPKIKFERPDGSVGRSPGCGTALMSIGTRGNAALTRAGLTGLGLLVEPSR
jgi:DNA N-6-adenine-methyltransferase Dam